MKDTMSPQSSATGSLFLISTPIGNLGDLSPRAREVLNSVTYILCELPAQTAKLGISSQLYKYEGKPRPPRFAGNAGGGLKALNQQMKVISDLQNGKSVALVSNSGTPLISDPGGSLVAAVVEVGLPVIHIPGPVAAVSAAITSGLPTKNLLFIGFLSKKEGTIRSQLEKAKKSAEALEEPASIVFYCSKYQLFKTLDVSKEIFGEQTRISIAREMTKLYEEHFTGSIANAIAWFNASPHRQKGEFTIVVTI